MQLRRFWIITFPEDPLGPRNIGVTAFTIEEAKQIARNAILNMNLSWIKIDAQTKFIEDIDIRSLDQDHVIPNIGVVSFQGIWFPNMNMQ